MGNSRDQKLKDVINDVIEDVVNDDPASIITDVADNNDNDQESEMIIHL